MNMNEEQCPIDLPSKENLRVGGLITFWLFNIAMENG